MEALLVNELPRGATWQYEPKWDGFRCLAFRDGDHVELQSKSGQPLARYFPEIVEALLQLKASQFVIDGELVITVKGDPSFDALLQRIHPAASRIAKLAKETPARLSCLTFSWTSRKAFSEKHWRSGVKSSTLREEFLRATRVGIVPAKADAKSPSRGLTTRASGGRRDR